MITEKEICLGKASSAQNMHINKYKRRNVITEDSRTLTEGYLMCQKKHLGHRLSSETVSEMLRVR